MISIIIPVYNAQLTLYRCIESVLAQDYIDWELILVDDESTDRSFSICNEFVSKDERICLLTQKHAGVSSARNKALHVAKGEFVCFVDSDDWIEPDYLSLMYRKKEYDMVVCGYCVDECDFQGNVINQRKIIPVNVCVRTFTRKESLIELFCSGMIHINCNKLLKMDIIRRNKIRYRDIPINEDYIFMLEYLMHSKNICTVENTTYHWVRVQKVRTGVNGIPDNLLQIYTDAHLLTIDFFCSKNAADKIMYYTYYFVALKYINAMEWNIIPQKEARRKLYELMTHPLVIASFETRYASGFVERMMNFLLLSHRFMLFRIINKLLALC